jgi:UDP-GlcNAc3NAcA epimerase
MKIKICTIVGARPQFIKAAVVSNAIDKTKELSEFIIHTGQHFDKNMSDSFFEELDIKKPKYNLSIHSKSHGEMTGLMVIEIEKILINERPRLVILYGDTDSTLAGAIAASKLGIEIAHVEAGLRSYNNDMPEEINRILTDRVSNLLFTPTKNATNILISEGTKKNKIFQVGDVMFDSCKKASKSNINNSFSNDEFILFTMHRKENTDSVDKFKKAVNSIILLSNQYKIVWPVHPRIKMKLKKIKKINKAKNIFLIDPVGYKEMIGLTKDSKMVITDSGGLQKEAFFMKKQCVTIREETEWVELLNLKWNHLVPFDDPNTFVKIVKKLINKKGLPGSPYGAGNSGSKIVKVLLKHLG